MSRKAFQAARQAAGKSLTVTALLGTMALAACSTVPVGSGPAPVASGAFDRADFVWSSAQGRGGIQGQVTSTQDGTAFSCIGSVGLTPATPYTDARFQTLYGSNSRAQLPAEVVRARTVPDPSADYSDFLRSTACENNRFDFANLPDGRWYVIAPVRAGQGPVTVLMQQVHIRNGRTINLSL